MCSDASAAGEPASAVATDERDRFALRGALVLGRVTRTATTTSATNSTASAANLLRGLTVDKVATRLAMVAENPLWACRYG